MKKKFERPMLISYGSIQGLTETSMSINGSSNLMNPMLPQYGLFASLVGL